MTDPTSQHILINGAGLAGFALAVALAKRGIRTSLFEIRISPKTIGGQIALAPNGLRVLDRIVGVSDSIRKLGFEFEKLHAYADDGLYLGSRDNGNGKEFGYPAMIVRRSELLKTLKDAALEFPNLIEVHWDLSIAHIKETETGVNVTLNNGQTMQGTIVVGADGIHSRIRKHVLGDSAPTPTYSGVLGLRGVVRYDDVDWSYCKNFPAMIYSHRGFMIVSQFRPDANEIGWTISGTTPERSREGWDEYIRSGEALEDWRRQFEGAPQPIKDILEKTTADSVRGWPPYEIPDISTWHTSKVILVGDAAHAMTPWAGQGSSLAFEDIGFLTLLLSDPKSLEKGYEAIFTHFESVRRPRIQVVRDLAALIGRTRTVTGNWYKFQVLKYAMWAILRLGYGRSQGRFVYEYDVEQLPLVAGESTK